ncbi:MAG TPA: hypothetical protein VM370_00970 [Candidatus Thermoplasmatota archaeon]|nr:hypothetical protein [Candidatus Thermoplasmatota archaeon]
MEGRVGLWQAAGWTVSCFAVGGGLAGATWYVMGVPFHAGELAALLVIASSLAAMAAILTPLRRARTGRPVAALAAWAAVAAFFGIPLALAAAPIPRETILMLLGVTPLLAAGIAFAGAAHLARGVRLARARRVPR